MRFSITLKTQKNDVSGPHGVIKNAPIIGLDYFVFEENFDREVA